MTTQEDTKDLLFFLECPNCLEYMTQKIFVCLTENHDEEQIAVTISNLSKADVRQTVIFCKKEGGESPYQKLDPIGPTMYENALIIQVDKLLTKLTGHSLCFKCWRKLQRCPQCKKSLSETRNFTLESVAQVVRFPCPNTDFGCRDFFLPGQIDDHANFCSFRIYKCRASQCKWTGRLHQINDHWLEKHKELTLAGNSNIGWWNISNKDELELISAHNAIFFFHKKVSEKNLHFIVQYIGREEDVIQYVFKVTIYSEEYAHRKIKILENCHNDHLEDISELIDSGFTACIPLANMETYTSPLKGNLYQIDILKI